MLSKDAAVAEFLAVDTLNSELKLKAEWLDPVDLVGDHFMPSLADKFIHFVVQTSGWFVIPMWCLTADVLSLMQLPAPLQPVHPEE